jgi:hypothetical protein
VAAGFAGVADGVMNVSETIVPPGLLVDVAGLTGQGDRGGVLRPGLAGLAAGQEGGSETVEGICFARSVAYLAEQGQSALVIADGAQAVASVLARA